MPQMSTIISGAASLGVLAGVVSGIFYLVLTGIRWAGRVRAALKEEEERKNATRCVACGRTFSASAASPVVCTVCGKRACFDVPCSRPAPIGWNCVVCHIKRNLDSSSGSSWTDVKSDDEKQTSSSDVDGETVKVREFIEKLVEKIVGGSLDGVTVGKLTNHPAYDEMFTQYHEQLCQALARLGFALQLSLSSQSHVPDEAPTSAHTTLIQLIETLTNDASKLPNLSQDGRKAGSTNGRVASTLGDKSYEDILSTAILNKVIKKYQQQNGYYEERMRDSLLEGEESDWSDVPRSDPLALKIEEHIEEVTTAYGSSSDDLEDDVCEEVAVQNRRVPFPEYGVDIVEDEEANNISDADSESCATDILSSHSTWEENWLFQRKKLKLGRNSHHPVPVPMLVPNPSQEFRALIGGVDADDISDLSECSDSALEEAMSEATEDPNKVLEIIDALNRESISEDESNSHKLESSKSENSAIVESEEFAALSEDPQSSDTAISKDSLEVESELVLAPSPTPSLGEQDRDVPVDYEVVTRIDRPPVPKPRTHDKEAGPEIASEIEEKPIVCPIAEREKAKWNNAIEMKDNPYTPENIAKRIKSQQFLYLNGKPSTDYVDFPAELNKIDEPEVITRNYGRDYYVKASKSPTGEVSTRSSESPVSMRSETSIEYFATLRSLELTLRRQWTAKMLERNKEGEDILVIHRVVEHQKPHTSFPQIDLPKVQELKKNFLAAKPPIPVRVRSLPHKEPPKEPEIDYSLTPVSEIITNLQSLSANVAQPSDKKREIFNEVDQIRRESLVRLKEIEETASQGETESTTNDEIVENWSQFQMPEVRKKPLKPVHSLTARSIPKDFREGLKNSQHKKITNTDRLGEIYSASDNSTLPPLNFDVKNKKKFWENIAKERKVN